jgi:hypothetical protein
MLTVKMARALSGALYDAGFTGVARLLAEGTTDVFEFAADGPPADAWEALMEAATAAKASGHAQLVLVTPDGEGEWAKPELVPVISEVLEASARHATTKPTPDVFGTMRDTLERGR